MRRILANGRSARVLDASRIVQLALLLARLLLAAVFLLAGLAKFADPKGTSKALNNFGIPLALAALFSLLLPLAELTVAVALVPVASAWYGACGAAALLGIFIIGIAITLARGRAPDCHCFGQVHSAPIGKKTLIRNAVLGALAGGLVYMGPARVGPSLWEHLAAAGDNEKRLFAFAAVILCFLMFRALRQPQAAEPVSVAIDWWDDEEDEETPAPREAAPAPRESAPRKTPRPPKLETLDPALQKVLEAGTGWPVGTHAPDFTLPDVTGQQCSLQSLRDHGKPILLVFSSPHCEPCKALWPYISRWTREHEQALNLMVISRGPTAGELAKQHHVDASRVLLQQRFEISDAYGVRSTPGALLVGPDGLIQSQLAVGRDDIGQLIASAVQASQRATSSS